ncbi:hypothetical protein B5X24_HaOG207629 [Helicoverpa armigera]|uniref:Uncharacterized protein n=1 Tax=Helicoverpa armigera TaxID=29058 RepID=A0A2W1BJZ3_HELAM|nr:hypothetical protein B5X24_HaOG207629 [Helicoverpa armigera]
MCGSGQCTDGPECALPGKGTAVSSSRQSAAATSRTRPWFKPMYWDAIVSFCVVERRLPATVDATVIN